MPATTPHSCFATLLLHPLIPSYSLTCMHPVKQLMLGRLSRTVLLLCRWGLPGRRMKHPSHTPHPPPPPRDPMWAMMLACVARCRWDSDQSPHKRILQGFLASQV